MSLVIKHTSIFSNYNLKSTHTGSPYLQINKSQYLDLTTNTTIGTYVQILHQNSLFRPMQEVTLTKSMGTTQVTTTAYSGYSLSNGVYTTTTGYSGSSSRGSTSGYSGVSSRASTSNYKGSLSRASTSGYSGRSTYTLSRTSLYGYTGKTTSSKSGTKGYIKMDYFTARLAMVLPSASVKTVSYSCKASTHNTATTGATRNASCKGSWSGTGTVKNGYNTWNMTQTNGVMTKKFNHLTAGNAWANYTFTLTVRGFYGTAKLSCNYEMKDWWSKGPRYLSYTHTHTGRNSTSTTTASGVGNASSTAVGALKSTTQLTRTSSYTASSYRTSAAVGALLSVTGLTRSSAYTTTSSVAGNMSGAAAQTRTSGFNTTAVAAGNMSNTTALTRSSGYATSSTAVGNMSNTTALTATSGTTSSYLTTASHAASGTTTVYTRSSNIKTQHWTGVSSQLSTYGYSGSSSRVSTSGYTGRKNTSSASSLRTIKTVSTSATGTFEDCEYITSSLSLLNTTSASTIVNNSNYLSVISIKSYRTKSRTANTGTRKGYKWNETWYSYPMKTNGWTGNTFTVSYSLGSSEKDTDYSDYYYTFTDYVSQAVKTWEWYVDLNSWFANTSSGSHTTTEDGYSGSFSFSGTVTKAYASMKEYPSAGQAYYYSNVGATSRAYSTSNHTSYSGSNRFSVYGTIDTYHTGTVFTMFTTGWASGTQWLTSQKTYTTLASSTTTNATLLSTTALTRISNYATSSTGNAGLSSTTALTRASNYGTTAANSSLLSAATAVTYVNWVQGTQTITNVMSNLTALTATTGQTSFSTYTTEQ